MKYITDPGPWLQYRSKPGNEKLSLHEATQQYKQEQLFHDLQNNQAMYTSMHAGKVKVKQFSNRNQLRIAAEEWAAFPFATERYYGHISTWDVSNITDFRAIFKNIHTMNDDISSWDVSKGTTFQGMFASETNSMTFNQDISGWDISKATTIAGMFDGNPAFSQDISSWNPFSLEGLGGILFINGSGAGLTTANYNKLLVAWAAHGAAGEFNTAVRIHFGESTATDGGAGGNGATARTALRAAPATGDSWVITDGDS